MGNYSNLMTIKEFAEASGRSQQTIYKQIETRLAPYLYKIEGKKYIDRRALKEVFEIDVEQSVQPENNNSFNYENNPEHPLYAILKAELEVKNRQIEQLTAQLTELAQANKELAESINAARHNELAGTLKEMLPESGSPECQDEIAINAEPGDSELRQATPEEDMTETLVGIFPDPEKKPDFWQRCRNAWNALKGE